MTFSEMKLIETFAEYMTSSKYVTVLSGHLVSADSGVPIFKLTDEERWDPKIAKYLQGYDLFKEDPQEYWKLYRNPPDFFRIRRKLQEKAQPNPIHLGMKELEEMDVVKFLVTEATDDLYRKAGLKNFAQFHGNIYKMRCDSCNNRFEREIFPDSDDPPKCRHCGGYVKTDIIHFGEPISEDTLQRCNEEASRSDMMMVVGSSVEIYPAASLPQIVKQKGGRLGEINREQTSLSLDCDISLRGKPGEIFPLLVEAVRAKI